MRVCLQLLPQFLQAELIIKIIAPFIQMNTSFPFVQQCLLNTSKSKQTHLFPKAPRFSATKAPNCSKSSYDLTKTMFASSITPKTSIMNKGSRFRSDQTVTPGPNVYHHSSFIDINRSTSRGSTFSHDAKLVRKDKDHFPGPNTYGIPCNPQKKLSYTMRSKIQPIDKSSKLGPGQYNMQSYQAFQKPVQVSSKYANPKTIKIGTAPRFKSKAFETDSPGPTAHGRVKTQIGETSTKYSFGKHVKEPSYIRSNNYPGPNYYNRFSEFAQLKNGLGKMHQSSRTIAYM